MRRGLDLITQTAADPLAAARAFASAGGKVVGFLSNNVPVELIHAAGCFPLQLPALPGAPTPLADRYMETLFDPMARSVFDRMLAGDFDFIDLIVLPRTVDSFQRLYYYACELRRTGVLKGPDVFLYDLLHTPYYSSAEHNVLRTRDLAARLGDLAGRPIDPASVAASTGLYDGLRERLARAAQLRRAVPSRLGGEAALNIFTASQALLPEIFIAALDQVLADPPPSGPAGPRVILAGSAHDRPDLHGMVSRAGGAVVGDFHARGDLLFGPPVKASDDPVRALSDHYHRHTLSSRTYPSPDQALLAFARDSEADAAIFFYFAQEEALVWDYPAQARALRAAGVKVLELSQQAYPVDPAVDRAVTRFMAEAR